MEPSGSPLPRITSNPAPLKSPDIVSLLKCKMALLSHQVITRFSVRIAALPLIHLHRSSFQVVGFWLAAVQEPITQGQAVCYIPLSRVGTVCVSQRPSSVRPCNRHNICHRFNTIFSCRGRADCYLSVHNDSHSNQPSLGNAGRPRFPLDWRRSASKLDGVRQSPHCKLPPGPPNLDSAGEGSLTG